MLGTSYTIKDKADKGLCSSTLRSANKIPNISVDNYLSCARINDKCAVCREYVK